MLAQSCLFLRKAQIVDMELRDAKADGRSQTEFKDIDQAIVLYLPSYPAANL